MNEETIDPKVSMMLGITGSASGSLLLDLQIDFPQAPFTSNEVLQKYADTRGYLKKDVGGWKGAQCKVLNLLGLLVQDEELVQLDENTYRIKR